jgi:hypothetical protein
MPAAAPAPVTGAVTPHAPSGGTEIVLPGGAAGMPVVAGNGDIYVAPALTPCPSTLIAEPASPWRRLGLVTEDGVTWTPPSEETEEVKAWQSRYPVRIVTTGLSTSVGFSLLEWSRTTVEVTLGGGTWEDSGELVIYKPPPAGAASEVALFVAAVDGSRIYGIYLPKCKVTERDDINFKADAPAVLNMTLAIVGQLGLDPYQLVFGKDTLPGAVEVTGVDPAAGAAAGGTQVTITGKGFGPATQPAVRK